MNKIKNGTKKLSDQNKDSSVWKCERQIKIMNVKKEVSKIVKTVNTISC